MANTELDMEDRDPNHINPSLKTSFSDVIAEPPGVRSADCVWKNSFKCFNAGMGCCYGCLTFVCSLPLALFWGCYFACLAFSHVWCVTPGMRAFNILFSMISRLLSTLIHCCCDPCYESMALFFTKIYVRVDQGGGPYESKSPEDLNMLREVRTVRDYTEYAAKI